MMESETGLTQPTSSTASGTPPLATSETAAPSTPPEPFRFGDTSPEWMRGRTEAEVATIAEQMAQVTQNYVTQSQTMTQPPQQVAQQQPQFDPDEVMTGRQVAQLLAQAQQQVVQQFQSAQAPTADMVAGTNLSLVKERHKQVFGKYGPEIYALLAHLPKNQWNIDSLEKVVKIVRADHVDDIVAEEVARRRAKPDSPSLRATGTETPETGTPSTGPDAGLTDTQRSTLRRNGITLNTVREFCAANGMKPEKWFEMYGKHAVGDAE